MDKLDPVVRRFSHRLRQSRRAAGLTRTALAAKVGLSVPYVSLLEQGKREPSIVTVAKMAKALKVKPGALIDP